MTDRDELYYCNGMGEICEGLEIREGERGLSEPMALYHRITE